MPDPIPFLGDDDELEAALEQADRDADEGGSDPSYQQALAERLAHDEARTLAGVGRAILRARRELEQLDAYFESVKRDYQSARYHAAGRLEGLDAVVLSILQSRRDRDDKVTRLELPGVHTWTSTATQPGWTVPDGKAATEAIIAALPEEELDRIAPRQRVLSPSALREYLDEQIAPARKAIDPKAPRREQAAKLEDAAREVKIPHVAFRAPAVSFKGITK